MSTLVTDVRNISSENGEEFCYLVECIDNMKNNPDKENIESALESIKKILFRCFDIKCKITVLDTDTDSNFFGFNIYPDTKICRKMIDLIIDDNNKHLDEVRDIWKDNSDWVIEIDSKILKDISRPFSGRQLAVMLLYEIDRICFNFDIVEKTYSTIRKSLISLPFVVYNIAKSSFCRNVYIIPFIRICGYKNFTTKLSEDCLIYNSEYLRKSYISLISDILRYYGTTELIDKNPYKMEEELIININWIFTGINDLKITFGTLKDLIMKQITIEKSFYIKNVLISIYQLFASYDKTSIITEAHKLGNNVSPKALEYADNKALNETLRKVKQVQESCNVDRITRKECMDYIKKLRAVEILYIEVNNKTLDIETIHDYLSKAEKMKRRIEEAILYNKNINCTDDEIQKLEYLKNRLSEIIIKLIKNLGEFNSKFKYNPIFRFFNIVDHLFLG